MERSFQIDSQLLAVASVKLEDDPEALQALIDILQADTDQGAKLRGHFVNLKARHAANLFSGDAGLFDDIIQFVDIWRKVYPHWDELNQSGESVPAEAAASSLKTPVDTLSIFTLERLSALSGRTETEILDDVQLGVLRASILAGAVDADDHTRRQVLKAGCDDPFTVIRPRVVWITNLEAGELRRQGEVVLMEADYPVFVDCIASPPVKRYRKERVIFAEPYTATYSDMRFLDGDAIHYIAKHTGRKLVTPEAAKALPRLEAGGSVVVYRLLAEHPSVEPELPGTAEKPAPSPASVEPGEAKPQYKGPLQDAAIQEALSKLGYELGSLPPQNSRSRGARAEVWDLVKSNRSLFVSRDAYIHAWKRVNRQAKSKP